MKHELSRPGEVVESKQDPDITAAQMITYGDLLCHVRNRRQAELEDERPGHKNNANARSNTTRALTVFMTVNGLTGGDTIGDELVGNKSCWSKALQALGSNNTARRQKSELNSRIRSWAMELVRVADIAYDDETFGRRLSRLRQEANLTVPELAQSIVKGSQTAVPSTLHYWESDVRRPEPSSRKDIILIAGVLSVPPEYLLEKLPNSPQQAMSHETGLPRSIQRRVSQHLPDNFEDRSLKERDEILAWVSENILSTPLEVLEDGLTSSPATTHDYSVYALSRRQSARMVPAPAHLLDELDRIHSFKTSDLVFAGKARNMKWGSVTAKKADYDLRAFLGALHQIGLPKKSVSLSVSLCPEAIDCFIEWKRARRGGYTRAIEKPLVTIEALLNPEYGLIAQEPGFGQPLESFPSMISPADVQRVQDDWVSACAHAKAHINQRINEVAQASKKGRDPFESLLTVLEAEDPLRDYYRIVFEIRRRMPDGTYPVRRAEGLRSLMMLRLGLELCFRQRNLRELLLCRRDEAPRSWKELKRLKRGEMSFDEDVGWQVRMPREAFKNANSKALSDENSFPLIDIDDLYSEIEDYLGVRSVFLGQNTDPGTFFLKTTTVRSKTAEHSQNSYYNAFRAIITTYGIYNPFTGSGAIDGLRPHGPHSVRHIIATASVKRTGGYSDAAALLLDSEEMVRKTYARFLPGERHTLARGTLWGPVFNDGIAR